MTPAAIASLQGISEDIAERGVSEIDQASRDELTGAEWREIERACRERRWSITADRSLIIAGRYDQWGQPWIWVRGTECRVDGGIVRARGSARWVSVATVHGWADRPVAWTGTEWTWLTPEIEQTGVY